MAKDIKRNVTIYINDKEVENTVASLQAHLRKLNNEQKKLTINTEEYISKTREIREVKTILEANKKAIQGNNDAMEISLRKLSDLAEVVAGVQAAFQMGDAAIGSLKQMVNSATEFDDILADVRKTTGLTKDEVLQLNDALKKIDTRTSLEQLNNLAYAGGKLGLSSQEAVLQFTKAADIINVALGDVLGSEAMVTIGKMTDVYSKASDIMAEKNLEERMIATGSAINELAQSSTASEPYLVEFAARLGGIAVQAGLSLDQILGFASALDQNQQKVEMASTAFQRLLQEMISAPAEFAKTAQMPIKEFTDLIKNDMNTAVLKVLAGFRDQGGLMELQQMFNELGLDGARASAAISSMANSIDKITTAQAIANEEMKTGNSVVNEFNVKNNTLQAQQEKAKKAFQEVQVELGEALYPIVIKMTKASSKGVKMLNSLIKLFKEDKITLVALTTAVAGLSAALVKKYAIKLKNYTLTKAQFVQEKANAIQLKINTALEQRRTLARERDKLAMIQQQIALNQKIIADRAEYVAMGNTAVVLAAERNLRFLNTQATAQATVVENAHTASVKARNIAFKATPWGLMISCAAVLTAGIVRLVKASDKWKLNHVLKDTTSEFATADAELRVLLGTMKDTTAGTNEYNTALDTLKSKYPELISQFVDEKGKINDLEGAYLALSKAAKDSIFDRVKTEKITEAVAEDSKKAIDAMAKVRRIFSNHADDGKANFATAQVDKLVQGMINGIKYDTETLRAKVAEIAKDAGLSAYQSARVAETIKSLNIDFQQTARLEDELNTKLETTMGSTSTIEETAENINEETVEGSENLGNGLEDATSALNKMKSALANAKNLIQDLTNKNLVGAAKIFAEIETKTKNAKDNLLEAYGVMDENRLPKDAKKVYDELTSTANEAKLLKMQQYLEKANSELVKMGVNVSKNGDNKWMDDVTKAAQELSTEIANIDNQMKQLYADKNFIALQVGKMGDNDPLKADYTEQLNQLDQMIAKFQSLRSAMVAGAYNGIDTTQNVSHQRSQRAMDIADEDGLSWLLGNSYVDDLDEIIQDYTPKIENLQQARDAENAIIENLKKSLSESTNDQEKKAIEDEIAVHQQKVDVLNQEVIALQNMESNSLKLARNKSLEKTLTTWTNRIQKFADIALDIFGSMNQLLDNIAQNELQKEAEIKDKHLEQLEDRYAKGLISEEKYNKEKAKIEKDYDDKEKAVSIQQWKRQKAMNISQATMAAALAVMQTWADATLPTMAKAVMSALVAANMAIQLAAIAKTPAPYAKGGYVNGTTFIMAGEAGQEWIASNSLLRDPDTAPYIEALEKYQRGDKSLFGQLSMAQMNFARTATAIDDHIVMKRDLAMATTTANSNILGVLKKMSDYLEDPRNRQAYISRETQTDFDDNENFLRRAATL